MVFPPKNVADRLRNIAEVESSIVYHVVTIPGEHLAGTISQVTDDDFVLTPPRSVQGDPSTVRIAAVSSLTTTNKSARTYVPMRLPPFPVG
jgi:hypothetical protein